MLRAQAHLSIHPGKSVGSVVVDAAQAVAQTAEVVATAWDAHSRSRLLCVL